MNFIQPVVNNTTNLLFKVNWSAVAQGARGMEVGYTLSSNLEGYPRKGFNACGRALQLTYSVGLAFRALGCLNYVTPHQFLIQAICFSVPISIGSFVSLSERNWKILNRGLKYASLTVSLTSAVALFTLGQPVFASATLGMLSIGLIGEFSGVPIRSESYLPSIFTPVANAVRLVLGGYSKKALGVLGMGSYLLGIDDKRL